MHARLWRWIERISWFLEDPQERQTVLGDIHERGANFAALVDLVGLVLRRQLRMWTSWQPWALTASLILQFAILWTTPFTWTQAPYMGRLGGWMDNQVLLIYVQGTFINFILAYGVGFSLGVLGKRTALTMLPILAAWPLARSVPRLEQLLMRDVPLRGITPVIIFGIALVILVLLPLGYGLIRGFRGASLQRHTAIGVGCLFLTLIGYTFVLGIVSTPRSFPQELALNLSLFWPVFYALTIAIFPRYKATLV